MVSCRFARWVAAGRKRAAPAPVRTGAQAVLTAMARQVPVFTIPPGVSFVDALAVGMLHRAGRDPVALSRATVLLPTRRACRSLREAFLRRSDGAAILLPRITPLADVDDTEMRVTMVEEPGFGSIFDVPPA